MEFILSITFKFYNYVKRLLETLHGSDNLTYRFIILKNSLILFLTKKNKMKEFIKHKFPYLFFLLLLSNFVVVYGQERTVTLNMSKVPLSSVLTEIEKQTSMSVVYNIGDVDINRIVSIKVSKESLSNVMNILIIPY